MAEQIPVLRFFNFERKNSKNCEKNNDVFSLRFSSFSLMYRKAAIYQPAPGRAMVLRPRQNRTKKAIMPILFVMATLVCGLSFRKIHQWLSIMGDKTYKVGKTQFYQKQLEYGNKIVDLCQRRMKIEQSRLRNGTVISIDGSWDHRRNGQWCITEAIDTVTKKVIAYSIVSKKTFLNRFVNASNQMELACTKKLIEILNYTKKIIGYVHDKDAKTTHLFHEKWNIAEYYDLNHNAKSFKRRFNKANSGKVKGIAKHQLNGISDKLLKFLRTLSKSNFSCDQKRELWLNVAQHFSGNHTGCIHKPFQTKEEENKALGLWKIRNGHVNKTKIEALQVFLNYTLKLVSQVDANYNTQTNEAFHSIKAKLADKQIQWNASFPVRMAIAILKWNYPTKYLSMISKELGIPQDLIDLGPVEDDVAKQRNYDNQRYNKSKATINNNRRMHRKSTITDKTKDSGYRFTL